MKIQASNKNTLAILFFQYIPLIYNSDITLKLIIS